MFLASFLMFICLETNLWVISGQRSLQICMTIWRSTCWSKVLFRASINKLFLPVLANKAWLHPGLWESNKCYIVCERLIFQVNIFVMCRIFEYIKLRDKTHFPLTLLLWRGARLPHNSGGLRAFRKYRNTKHISCPPTTSQTMRERSTCDLSTRRARVYWF